MDNNTQNGLTSQNNRYLGRDEMMAWIMMTLGKENEDVFVGTSARFYSDDESDGIHLSAEDRSLYHGMMVYDYNGDFNNAWRENGFLSCWEEKLNDRGWYSDWYDGGTIILSKIS